MQQRDRNQRKYAIDKNASEKDMREIAKAIADELVKFSGSAGGK